MRKVVLAGMLFAGLSSLFISCNNGDYNADAARNVDILNPLNPESGVTVSLGMIQAEIDGSMRQFSGAAGWTDSVAGTLTFTGNKYDNPTTTEFLGASMSPSGGVGDYYVADSLQHTIFYGVMDTTNGANSVYILYQGKVTSGGSGPGVINLKGTESARVRGTFSGTLHKVIPVLDLGDVKQITNGEFYVPKH